MSCTLVLESYASIRRILVDILWRKGWEIDLAQTDQQALDLLTSRDYDTLLLDMDLPMGDGWTVLKWCQEHHKTTPVVALVSPKRTNLDGLQAYGVTIVLPKPIDRAVLLQAMDTALASATVCPLVLASSERSQDPVFAMI